LTLFIFIIIFQKQNFNVYLNSLQNNKFFKIILDFIFLYTHCNCALPRVNPCILFFGINYTDVSAKANECVGVGEGGSKDLPPMGRMRVYVCTLPFPAYPFFAFFFLSRNNFFFAFCCFSSSLCWIIVFVLPGK